MAKYEIATLLSKIKLIQLQRDDLLSEIGSFTKFAHPRQLIKLAGLTVRENSSRQQKGQKPISKRGRSKLRALLFRLMMPPLKHNQVHNQAFKQLQE